jgi:hypothetical protein
VSPWKSWITDLDWEWLSKFGVVSGMVIALFKWIFGPLVEKSIRRMFKDEMTRFEQMCEDTADCKRNNTKIVEEVSGLKKEIQGADEIARENRDWLIAVNATLAAAGIPIERRKLPRRQSPHDYGGPE